MYRLAALFINLAFLLLQTSVWASDSQELFDLQKDYLSLKQIEQTFIQKTFLAEDAEPFLSQGVVRINRKQKSFLWQVVDPIQMSFEIKNQRVRMSGEGLMSPQTYKLEDLPKNFSFVALLFEVLGLSEIQSQNWEVKKTSQRVYRLEPKKKEGFPLKDLKVSFFKSGAPDKVEFVNKMGTKTEIVFQKNKGAKP